MKRPNLHAGRCGSVFSVDRGEPRGEQGVADRGVGVGNGATDADDDLPRGRPGLAFEHQAVIAAELPTGADQRDRCRDGCRVVGGPQRLGDQRDGGRVGGAVAGGAAVGRAEVRAQPHVVRPGHRVAGPAVPQRQALVEVEVVRRAGVQRVRIHRQGRAVVGHHAAVLHRYPAQPVGPSALHGPGAGVVERRVESWAAVGPVREDETGQDQPVDGDGCEPGGVRSAPEPGAVLRRPAPGRGPARRGDDRAHGGQIRAVQGRGAARHHERDGCGCGHRGNCREASSAPPGLGQHGGQVGVARGRAAGGAVGSPVGAAGGTCCAVGDLLESVGEVAHRRSPSVSRTVSCSPDPVVTGPRAASSLVSASDRYRLAAPSLIPSRRASAGTVRSS